MGVVRRVDEMGWLTDRIKGRDVWLYVCTKYKVQVQRKSYTRFSPKAFKCQSVPPG